METLLVSKTYDKKIFLFILIITFTIFLFTSDGHRFTIDEDQGQLLAKRIVTQTPHPLYTPGESRMLFEYPILFPGTSGPICQHPLLCSPASIGYAITEIPFVFINHQINQIWTLNFSLSEDDFDDQSYVYWRNTLDPDFQILELFYGPVFSSISTGIFFLLCRSFNYTQKTSIFLSMLFALSTPIWAYSQTSLNTLSFVTFILLGYLFFKKYRNSHHHLNLLLCGSSFGFAYLIRLEAIFFVVPLFIFLIFNIRQLNSKILRFSLFILPLIGSFLFQKFIDYLNFGIQGAGVSSGSTSRITTLSNVICMSNEWSCTILHEGALGQLLSPGVGLLIYAPVLFTIFFSFPEFYKKHKTDFFLFITFLGLFLWYFGQADAWHGLSAWGPRYMIPLISFLLLPLGTSIEMRKKHFLIVLCILGLIGGFFNFSYLVQDVAYFVWGGFGVTGGPGLYGLATAADKYSVHPTVLWTFENSQLTHSIKLMLSNLQVDIFFYKLLGSAGYFTILSIVLGFSSFIFFKTLQRNKIINYNAKKEL